MKKTALFLAASLIGGSVMADWSIEVGYPRLYTLIDELGAANGWLSTELRARKYDKMAVSPFTFYRGTAHLYYRDLDGQDLIAASAYSDPSAVTWIQGDLHVQNYGAFDDDDGEVVFDLNDFDESWVANYLYDVWRAAASLVMVGRENGFGDGTIDDFVDAFSESYLDRLEDYRGNGDEKGAQLTEDNTYGRLDDFLDDVQDKNDRREMLDDWTYVGWAGRRFDLANEKLGPVSYSTRSALIAAVRDYQDRLTSGLAGNGAYFTVLDVAERLDAGTGSLGTPRYYVLIAGPSGSSDDDRILDVKRQGLPSVFPHLSGYDQARVLAAFGADQQGCRVAEAQKALSTDVDDHLGCLALYGESYSVRERSPYKESFDTAELDSTTRFTKLAEQWGWALAIDHARADRDHDAALVPDSFEARIHDLTDGDHAGFRAEVRGFARAYADQVAYDYQLFLLLRDWGII